MQVSRALCGVALVALATFGGESHAAAAVPHLTGLSLGSASATGATTTYYWNTFGGDGNFNIYVADAGGFLNAGDGAQTSIDVPLDVGVHRFTLHTDAPYRQHDFYYLNAFFAGDGVHPGISVFSPAQVRASLSNFTPNAEQTFDLFGQRTAAANATSIVFGDYTVALSAFSVQDPQFANLDLVGFSALGANGSLDYVATLEFQVTGPAPVPLPGAAWLLGSGLIGLLAQARRRGVSAGRG